MTNANAGEELRVPDVRVPVTKPIFAVEKKQTEKGEKKMKKENSGYVENGKEINIDKVSALLNKLAVELNCDEESMSLSVFSKDTKYMMLKAGYTVETHGFNNPVNVIKLTENYKYQSHGRVTIHVKEILL